MNLTLHNLLGLPSRAKHDLQRRYFAHRTSEVFQAGSAVSSADGPIVVSMVSKRDMHNYLVAVRSFCESLSPSRVVVLDGGGLDDYARRKIQRIVPFAEFLSVHDVDLKGLQSGGTWERLALIASLSDEGYIIQLDSDILCLGPLDDVGYYVKGGVPFIIRGDSEGGGIVPANVAASAARRASGNHVQTIFERNLGTLSTQNPLRYVRGCSAFTGFPKGSLTSESLRGLFSYLKPLCGERWREWGTEQVSVNFFLANLPNTVALPAQDFATYCGQPVAALESARLIHFIGTHRYYRGVYTELASDYLRGLALSNRST